ncbi:hypothetical protein RDI58_029552 [Solanum bulbocastanum]|uniref:Uncharacterized protein n=1 Tax=Solanum bulbocastanum TaxID=147425 RepID=A0AAN8Y284_SOLBU
MKFIKLTLLNIKLYLKVSQVSLLSHYSSHRLPLRTPTTGAQPPSPRTGATPPSPTTGATHHRSSSGGRLQQQRRSPTAEEARVSSRRNIVVLYLLRVGTDHLHKKKTRIFGNKVLVNRLEVQSTAIEKRRIRRRSLGIVVHHPQASMAGIERQYLQWRVR